MGTTTRTLTNLGASSIPFDIPTGAVAAFFLDVAKQGYTINSARIYTTSGSCTVTFRTRSVGEGAPGTAITGLSALAVTSTEQNFAATAANVMVETDELILDITANVAGLHIRGNVAVTRG